MITPKDFIRRTRPRFMRAIIHTQMSDRYSYKKAMNILDDISSQVFTYQKDLNIVHLGVLALSKDIAALRYEVARHLEIAA